MHVRRHWKDRLTKDNWEGGPQIMPLSSEDIGALESMSPEIFQITAEHLLSVFARHSGRPPPVASKISGIMGSTKSEAPNLHTVDDQSMTPAPSLGPVDTTVEVVRPMVHGLFASLRRKLPLFRTKPP
jgi:hypothetical protein